jgi:hypothetical protein
MVSRLHSDSTLLLLAIAISCALLLPALFMDGMFMDGLLYTCVGKNLAAGKGSFWDPYFSATFLTSYHEQPPLKFALEAVFYRILGTSFLTERVFGLTMSISTFFAIRMIWRIIFPLHSKERNLIWLPALLFFISPVTFYAFTNNVEEGTMVVFALFSAAFILRGIYISDKTNLWFAIGGIMLVCSSLCKGFQGLFPLVIPMVWWMCVGNISFRKALTASVIVTLIPAIFYLLISFHAPAYNSYTAYFHDRFYSTFNVANAATTQNRFFLLYELLLDLLPILAIAALFMITSRKEKNTLTNVALAFFLVGMAGILPLMVTLEQRGFYLVTGLPFVTTAIALLCVPGALKFSAGLEARSALRKSLSVAGALLLTGTLIATFILAGKPKRDREMLSDVKLISQHAGTGKILSTDANTFAVWSLQGYLMRYYDISVSKADTASEYFIVPEGVNSPAGYMKVPLTTTHYHLYTK